MKRVLKVCAIVIAALVLAGCFPSERLYVVEDCDGSTCSIFDKGSEFAFVKESDGENWRVWVRQSAGTFKEVCTAKIENDTFQCDGCQTGKDDSIVITKTDSSECSYDNCVSIKTEGTECPGPGSGKGGHN